MLAIIVIRGYKSQSVTAKCQWTQITNGFVPSGRSCTFSMPLSGSAGILRSQSGSCDTIGWHPLEAFWGYILPMWDFQNPCQACADCGAYLTEKYGVLKRRIRSEGCSPCPSPTAKELGTAPQALRSFEVYTMPRKSSLKSQSGTAWDCTV